MQQANILKAFWEVNWHEVDHYDLVDVDSIWNDMEYESREFKIWFNYEDWPFSLFFLQENLRASLQCDPSWCNNT